MEKVSGRVPEGTGLSQAEPSNGLGPPGFDPSRGVLGLYMREIPKGICPSIRAKLGDGDAK